MASETLDLAALPTPQSITLIVKNKKSTTLLSVQPTSNLDDIRVLLFAALKSCNAPDLPESPDAIELGILADKRDTSKGWVPLHLSASEGGAGKLAKKRLGKNKNLSNASVESAKLSDNTWLAWRLKSSAANDEIMRTDEDGDAVVVDDIDEQEDPGWDVVIPKYDEEEDEV